MAAFVLIFAICCAPIWADTITLQQGLDSYTGAEDTSIFEDFPDNSSGGFPYMFAGVNKGASIRRTLIKFDLQDHIPPGSTITSASLSLFTEFGRATQVDCTLHRITRAWTEGNNPLVDISTIGQGAPAQPGDPTWKTAASGEALAQWETLGGDFEPSASGSGHIFLSGVWFSITGTGMVDDLQNWLDFGNNNGWMLRASENGFQNAKRFYSSEGQENRPKLWIEFTPPSAVSEWVLY